MAVIVITEVRMAKEATRDLIKIPAYIRDKLYFWKNDVELKGVEEVRKIPGYRDHPLKGNRRGQRSVYLNRSYRAIYEISTDGAVEFVSVEEISNHKY